MISQSPPNFNKKAYESLSLVLTHDRKIKHQNNKSTLISGFLNSFLYHKFASSQNYYFTKNINQILNKSMTPSSIQFRQQESITKESASLSRFVVNKEQALNLRSLTEYYKYHSEVPRLFMLPISEIIHEFH